MNEEVYEKLVDLAMDDYDRYVRKFTEQEEENPGLSFDEVDELVIHGPMDIPEELQGYEEEYEEACLTVYITKTLEALLEKKG